MFKEYFKIKWLVGIMVVSLLVMLYAGLTGIRLLGSSAEKWSPEGHTNNHK
jgi:general stress protein CsbA